MPANTYRIIEENPSSKPAITISQIVYADEPYLQYEITNWGGSAVPIERGEEFSKALGSSIRYVKENCEKGGNLG
ncbi:hypothetical protein QUA54_31560 [Microcoleus sp. MOSTC5]|uniref:hypothetical protein n=1 Tax=Microcoleus sp. MOSTC5 TaxID=3055378 RepID=UPI002FD6821C